MCSVAPLQIDENNNSKKSESVEITREMPSLREQFLVLLRDWLSTSSCIGLPFIEKASCQAIRIVWIVFFLAAVFSTGYFIIVTLTSYFQYGVLNQIYLAKQYPTYFPAVAICNTNPFNHAKSNVYIHSLLKDKNLSDFINITSTDDLQAKLNTDNTIGLLNTLLEDLRWWVATDTNLNDSSRRALGFELDPDMLISCSFNNKKCTASDFTFFRSYKYGNCFVFNSGYSDAANSSTVELLKTSKTGNDYGLHMELLIGDPNDEVRFVYKSGVYIHIFNQSLSTLQLGDDGTFLPTGFDSYVAINREFYSKLPSPYSTCIEDVSTPVNDYAAKLYGYINDLGITVYSQDFCSSICYQDQLIDKCGCSDASLPNLRDSNFCNSSSFKCMTDFEDVFNEVNIDDQCQSACPVKCNTVSYKLAMSQSTYPTQYYISLLKTKSDFIDNLDLNTTNGVDYIYESLVKVVINYDDLQYSQITEIPVTTPDVLIGTLGGQLGAFIGITFLSLIEILDLIMNVARIVYLDYKRREANKQNQPLLFTK